MPSPASLIITGVVDGPLMSGRPRAVELYATGDILDLSAYQIAIYYSEFANPFATVVLNNVTLLGGNFYYLTRHHPTQFSDFFGFNADQNHPGIDSRGH